MFEGTAVGVLKNKISMFIIVTPNLKVSRIFKKCVKTDIGYINYTIQK
jgi:hypothetical protein